MLVAQEKYNTNIVEYLLYMFHIEDVVRANHFNMEELEAGVISGYRHPGVNLGEIREWYRDIIDRMTKDDVTRAGHMASLKELMFRLNDLHIELLNTLEEEQYLEHYQWARPVISELKVKMKDESMTEIEVCLNGLYGFMLLKLKGNEISEETAQAMAVFSQLLRYLSKKYHLRYTG